MTILLFCPASQGIVDAAVAQGKNQQVEVVALDQSGSSASSGQFKQQTVIGEATDNHHITSTHFNIIPGFLGAMSSTSTPISEPLDLTVLYAKTAPFGTEIAPQVWQRDRDPIFIWEPPASGLDLSGYSYAIDAPPDETVDTTATSFDVATSTLKSLGDGKHTFTVKAINTAGNSGRPVSFEVWIDTTAPQLLSSSPQSNSLLNTTQATVNLTVSETGSGVSAKTVTVLLNGSTASMTMTTQPDGSVAVVATGIWAEGANRIEVRLSDLLGNAQTPVLWGVTVDTTPPKGSILINGGANLTTSIYVTLSLSATDENSPVQQMLLSNERLAGYVQEPFTTIRELWKLPAVRGIHSVYVKFVDQAGNMSQPVSDDIEVGLLAPETVITMGPAGVSFNHDATFTFMCPEGSCVFSYAFDNNEWSDWSPETTVTTSNLLFGNHYFRVKAAKEVNGLPEIQPDEEDPSPAERTWIVGAELPTLTLPKGPSIKLWRVE